MKNYLACQKHFYKQNKEQHIQSKEVNVKKTTIYFESSFQCSYSRSEKK